MIQNLEQRKTELTQHLQEQYKERPRSWWQSHKGIYKTTSEMADADHHYPIPPAELAIRNDYKGALFTGALFIGGYWYFASTTPKHLQLDFSMLLLAVVPACFLIYAAVKALNRKPRLIFSEQGIRMDVLEAVISWDLIAATYIKEDDTGESSSYYLLIHYYKADDDLFVMQEYNLSTLDHGYKDIAFYIEYYRGLYHPNRMQHE